MEENTLQHLGIGARVRHPSFGVGIVVGIDPAMFKIFFRGEGDKEISRSFQGLEIMEGAQEPDNSLDLKTVERTMKRVLQEFSEITRPYDLGSRWKGGKMILKPGQEGLQEKEVPIEVFFHKIVMMRDRLRVMEQRVNSSDKLSDEEKVDLQQYISRIYGSMTTFNVLFAEREDWFISKSE